MTPLQPLWKLQGQLMGACHCATACSCAWLRPPAPGRSQLLVAWHIGSGQFSQLRLDNLNVAMACNAPGHRHDNHWQVALYIDRRADPDQMEALQQIFTGLHGGHPASMMTHVARVYVIQQVRIDFVDNYIRTQLDIPGIAHTEIEGVKTLKNKPSCISNPPLCAGNRDPSGVTSSRRLRYHDLGQHWEFSQSNGYYSPFRYQP